MPPHSDAPFPDSQPDYRTIFDLTADAICVYDQATGEILDTNRANCDLHGYTIEEIRARGIRGMSAPREPYTEERATELVRRAAAGEPQRYEWATVTRSGEEIVWDTILMPTSLHGRPVLVTVARDIRPLKTSEAALLRANEELERRVAERTAEAEAANAALQRKVEELEAAREQLIQREHVLQEREEHFRLLIENASDMVQIVEPDGRIVYTGPSVIRLLGFSPEEIQETSAFDYLHPEDVPQALEKLGLVMESPGVPQSVEYRVRHRSGEWRFFEARVRTLSPASAEQGLVVNARDITKRKTAERALREQEEHFRALIENAHDITCILDPDGVMTYQSPSLHRLLGWDPEEVIGRSAWEFIHPDDVDTVVDAIRRIIENPGVAHSAEYRFRHKDGSWRMMEAIGRTLSVDSPEQGVVSNVRDMTERRATEAALRESEERLRFSLEAGRLGAWEWDVAGERVVWSPTLEAIHGRAPGSFRGTFEDVLSDVHPDDRERLVASIQGALEGRAEHEIQYRAVLPDGSVRWLEAKGRVMRDEEGRPERMVGVCTDVTARREVEEVLRRATAEAERANHEKSEFLSRMSHELRTPMNSILGFAQILAELELAPEDLRAVNHILSAGEHLLNLINEVLDIARIESGRHQLSLEPVLVGSVVREAIDLVRPLALSRGIRVSEAVDAATARRFVRADRQRLAQVLLNLLSNAIKYNRPGGSVRLTCAPGEGGRLCLRVSDDGFGIPDGRREQLFTPFARLGAEQTGIEGTGLGLALSKRLVEAMGGTLFLERTGEQGSVFCAALEAAEDPLAAAALPEPAADAGEGETARPPATLLYVEDNLANLSLVERVLLSRPEWKLLPALQGQLGIELAREHAPDLILLDLHLPDLSGEEVLRELRADGRTAHIPVVVVSADATPKTLERLRSAGAEAYLTKPLNVKQFVGTIEQALAGPAQRP